jgi:hypothetical protein
MGEGQGWGVAAGAEAKTEVGADFDSSVIAGGPTPTQPSPIEGEGLVCRTVAYDPPDSTPHPRSREKGYKLFFI